MESSCQISLSVMLLLAVTLQKNELKHPQNRCSVAPFRYSTAYPPHFTRIRSSVRVSVCVLSFEDLLCGNWVMCSQSGFITWEIQWSIFPYCPCSCPERTSQRPLLLLSSLLPYPHQPSHIFTLWIYPASIQVGITIFYISVLQIFRGRTLFNTVLWDSRVLHWLG